MPEFKFPFTWFENDRKPTDAELFDNLVRSLSKKSSEKIKKGINGVKPQGVPSPKWL
jgi:hypothetical protein